MQCEKSRCRDSRREKCLRASRRRREESYVRVVVIEVRMCSRVCSCSVPGLQCVARHGELGPLRVQRLASVVVHLLYGLRLDGTLVGGARFLGCDADYSVSFFFFFQAEDGIRDYKVTGVQTCALPI